MNRLVLIINQVDSVLPRLRISHIVCQYPPKPERRTSPFGCQVDECRRQFLVHTRLRRVEW